MESESRSDEHSAALTPDCDSALGTMSDITPDNEDNEDNEETLTNSTSENFNDEEIPEDPDVSENESVVAASMQFTLTPSSDSKKSDENLNLKPEKVGSTGGVPVSVKHHKETLSSSISEEPSGTDGDVEDSILNENLPEDKEVIVENEFTLEDDGDVDVLIEEIPVDEEEDISLAKEVGPLETGLAVDNNLNKNLPECKEEIVQVKEAVHSESGRNVDDMLNEHIPEKNRLNEHVPEESRLNEHTPEERGELKEVKPTETNCNDLNENVPEYKKEPITSKEIRANSNTKGDVLNENILEEKEKPSILSEDVESLDKLPDTVTRLTNEEGSQVYLVGTAHFSKESQDDVSKTIRMVHPDIVMVELCKSRTAVLQLDEETILNESKSLDFSKMCVIIKQHGKIQGILYLLLLSVSAHITKQLGMAPGGEFRAAFSEARRSAPGCLIQLGDRPIQITLSRALAFLSVWQKVELMWHIMTSKEPISKEEVEKCKQKDFIEEMLADMTGEFPVISEVFVKERDIYLTKSLQTAARALPNPHDPNSFFPRTVVGVVGIGHMKGIVEHWGKVTDEDIPPIMRIPPPTLSDKICKASLKLVFYGVLGYGIYKCVPSSVKSTIYSLGEAKLQQASKLFSY